MKKLVDIILAVFICVVLISSYIYALSLYEENKLLKSDIKLKADLIDKYRERDSVMRRVYLGADSTGTFTYRHIGDSVISYRDLLESSDKLKDELNNLKETNRKLDDSLWVKTSVINMLREKFDFSYRIKVEKEIMTVTLTTNE